MPIGPWKDWNACVSHMTEEEGYDKESAERICGSLEQELEKEDGDFESLLKEILHNAKNIITDLTLDTFSFVDDPAQPSKFVLMKNQKGKNDIVKSLMPLVKEKNDKDWSVVYGAVLVPGITDKQGDVIPSHVIRNSAHNFLMKGQVNDIDSEHNLITDKGTLVESWLLQKDQEYELPDGETVSYPKGTWMVGVKPVDEIKNKIKNGHINGFSIYGQADKTMLKSEMMKTFKNDDSLKHDEENGIMTKEKENNSSVSLSDIQKQLNDIQTAVKENSERLEKQEIKDISDALKWVESNAPDEVLSLIKNELSSENNEDDEEDEDEDDDKKSNEENNAEKDDDAESSNADEGKPDAEGSDEEKKKKSNKPHVKKRNEEDSRKNQKDVEKTSFASFSVRQKMMQDYNEGD